MGMRANGLVFIGRGDWGDWAKLWGLELGGNGFVFKGNSFQKWRGGVDVIRHHPTNHSGRTRYFKQNIFAFYLADSDRT